MTDVAAFDFDGTISRRDTLVPFLARTAGPARFAGAGVRLVALGARRAVPLRDRDRVKEHLVELLLGGRSDAELREAGERYAADLLTSGRLRPEVVARIGEHHRVGHRTVIVSASLVYYLEPIARELSIDGVIGVEPEVDRGVLTGRLLRPNVRAEEKAIRLREWLGSTASTPRPSGVGVVEHAYGNSSGDHALLAMARHGWWFGRDDTAPPGSLPFRAAPPLG